MNPKIGTAIVAWGLLMCPGIAQAQKTADEVNTVEVFKTAAPAVVHVRSVNGHGQGPVGESSGSGFVIDREGYILTNYHVIQDSQEVRVVLASGQTLWATLVGTAPSFDIALLRVASGGVPPAGLAWLPLGQSNSVEVGQKVMAIGNPLGLHNTLTTGIVSGLARALPDVPVGLGETLIQTDAAINPGNSGGPLLDSAGKVIGINAMVAVQGQNIGFAIPVDAVKKIVPELKSMGHVYRPDLGMSVVGVTSGLAELFGLPPRPGLLVQEILWGGPAQKAGLLAGDRIVILHDAAFVLGGDLIVALNGKQVRTPLDLTAILLGSSFGDRVELEVLRGEEHRILTLVLPPMHF